MKRITPRTCLWPLVGCISIAFALSIGLTYRSNHHCYAGTCGEWLFPLQARLHVVVWYMWLSISIAILGLRAFQPAIRTIISRKLGFEVPVLEKKARISGVLLVLWISALYGVLIGIWWSELSTYFEERGVGLPGNNLLAAIALTGHVADVTMGMVLLPVSRHSALASFFKLAPSTTYGFHMVQAYLLIAMVVGHGLMYAAWVSFYNRDQDRFRPVYPVLNPTYYFEEVWPGSVDGLGIWRASLAFTGLTSTIIMLAMLCTSFPAIRRRYFNLFYFTHLLGIVAVVVICLHASTMLYCTLPGLSMWVLDWSMRAFELQEKMNGELVSYGNGWYSLTTSIPRKRLSGCACHSPLAHFYIHHSKSSLREIHPFTTITHLASKKPIIDEGDSISVQFLFREMTSGDTVIKSSQWTNRLGSLVDEEKGMSAGRRKEEDDVLTGPDSRACAQTSVRLEGPYFTSATPELYKTVVCLIAGTGLSGALAIAAAFKARQRMAAGNCNKSGNRQDSAATCIMMSEAAHIWQRCVVIWSVREQDFVDLPMIDDSSCSSLEFVIHKTGPGKQRLDMTENLKQVVGDDGNDSWVYISGPSSFISAAETACGQFRNLSWFAARWD